MLLLLLVPILLLNVKLIHLANGKHQKTSNITCGYHDEGWMNEQPVEFYDKDRIKMKLKDQFTYNIREENNVLFPPSLANKDTRYVQLVLVFDKRTFSRFRTSFR